MLYKIILALVAHYDLVIHQMDVKFTFLNGELNEEIYINSLNEFKKEEDLIYHFLKSLYELKQFSRIWIKILRFFFKEFNLVKLESNHCIFVN